MTLIGQHSRIGDNDSDNSKESVKNGNVDKIRQRQKNKKCIFSLDFLKTNDMEPSAIRFVRAPCPGYFLRPNPRKSVLSRALKLTL